MPNTTISFLRHVLPDEGFYCAIVFPTAQPGHSPRQTFFRTIEALADFLLSSDQQGRTVYHACASFREASKRTQPNVALVRSLWADIDCHSSGIKNGKPCYTDQIIAARAVGIFCGAAGLPGPLVVDSGWGLHCHWAFDRAVEPAEWQLLAAGLKALCVRHGLLADPARTADVASILRTPGTHNRKDDGERLVRYAHAGEQSPVESFRHLAGFAQGGDHAPLALPGQRPARRGAVIQRIDAASSYPVITADQVADRCPQINALRESGSVQGWFLRVGVVAFCSDGEVKAHAWSENDYPEYDAHVVDERLHRSRTLSGATTCARLDGHSPGICQQCPYWGQINSPISVPLDPLDVRLAPRSARSPLTAQAAPAQRITIDGVELPNLPEGFVWLPGGKLAFASEGPKGDSVEHTVSDFPVFLDTVQTGELDAARFSYKLRRHLPQEGWRDIVVDAKTLFGASSAAELADRGLVIHEHKHFLNYARHAVTDFHTEHETHIRYDQFGWKNDDTSFLYGDRLYTAVGPVTAIGAKEVQTRSQWIGPKKGGSVLAWTEAADALFAADMESFSTMLLASVAAPLMRFQSRDEGGCIIHLFTPASGQGKTTALTGAWTVWGTREGLSLTNEDTRVSKPITIGTLGNLPVIYDELQNRDPDEIKRFVVMFTEGRDRMRGMVDGTIRHVRATWQTLCLSASNNSLVDQVQGDGIDAPIYRILELHSTLPKTIDKTKGDRLKKILNDNAGHAGDVFLRYLTDPNVLPWAKAAVDKWTQDIWDATKLPAEHRFRVRAVGAIAVAAKICEKLDLLHFNTDRIVSWLVEGLGSHVNQNGGKMITPESATSVMGSFINDHMNEVLTVPDKYKPRQTMVPRRLPQSRLSVRYEIATARILIAEDIFRKWAVKNGFAYRYVLDELERAQIVVNRRKMATLAAGTDLPSAQIPCIEVNARHPAASGLVASVEELQVAQ